MTETYQLGLPLVQAAQAQKHVTVNDAFMRLDALSQLRFEHTDLTLPPVDAGDGRCYLVAPGASGDWLGHDGQIALFINGGWMFVAPKIGWRAYDLINNVMLCYDGGGWIVEGAVRSPNDAQTLHRVVELDHVLGSGATSATLDIIPNTAQVIGVTGRVIDPITGVGLTGWKLGVSGSSDRYGSGLGIALNSYAKGLTGTPVTYWSDTSLLLTAEGGDFASGTVRLAVHITELVPPSAI